MYYAYIFEILKKKKKKSDYNFNTKKFQNLKISISIRKPDECDSN